MSRRPTLVHHLLDDAAGRWPDHQAVSGGDRQVTYRRLYEDSLRLAGWLTERGVGRGDRLVVVAPGSPPVAALLFAASRIGAVFVVLHEQVTGAPLRHVLTDCEPSLLVSAEPADRETAAQLGVAVAHPDEVDARCDAADGPPATPTKPEPLTVDPVCLVYTSGTTSLPKAVVSAHQQVVFVTGAIGSQLRYRDDDVIYCALPPSFDYGLYQLFLAAGSGAHLVFGRSAQTGPLLLRSLSACRATVFPAVPALAEALARLVRRGGAGDLRLRLLTNTGAAMATQTLGVLRAALPGLRVQLMFGLTECKRTAIMPPDGDLRRPGASGLPLPGTEVFVVDEEGRRLGPGAVGEFVIRGPHVMLGYWRRPELTAERFPRRDGLFPELRSGDYGWLDDEGYLYFDGRRDDIYKERGFRVSATEVETAAHRVPGVDSATVLPPERSRGAVLVAVTTRPSDEVLGAMPAYIEPFKIPQRCLTVDVLPLTRNGKVDRKALTVLAEEGSDAR
ncbi:class I adenylate-forming enzyme family protein [Micromonospora sp. NPDC047074]|uniref:class I adenylate-forming enzyme family protein n=1 Tax=Micromonospora sp. NPDC047074 TaxID=3154339 RepID=UPI00340EAB22